MNIRSLPHLALLIVGAILLTEWIQESTEKQEDDSPEPKAEKKAKKPRKGKDDKENDSTD